MTPQKYYKRTCLFRQVYTLKYRHYLLINGNEMLLYSYNVITKKEDYFMKYEFPENFKWGSAVWALGTEGCLNKGGRVPTVFDEYYRLQPERFYNQVGPGETLNWYEDYEKFAQLAKDISHNSFRTSILWARLMPDGKTVNEEAVEFYRHLFQSFKNRGMELSIVLYWFDMPLPIEQQGGFRNREVISLFEQYCQNCFDLFDDLVDIWYIYNEPIVDVQLKYIYDTCYPNICDFKLAQQVIYNMVVAHAKVVKNFNSKKRHGKIGSVMNISQPYPRSQHLADLKAKRNFELLYILCFLEPLYNGRIHPEWIELLNKYDLLPKIYDEDLKLIADNKVQNIMGLNIYFPERIKCKEYLVNPESPLTFESFYDHYNMPGRQMNNDRGWEIYPRIMYDTLMWIKRDYGNIETRITENGIGIQNEYKFRNENGQIQDDYRIDYVKKHLIWAHKAIEDGANLTGYNMWSFVDLWSPSNQFKNCYGFYEFDLKTKEVKKKKSADWFKNITEENGFDE